MNKNPFQNISYSSNYQHPWLSSFQRRSQEELALLFGKKQKKIPSPEVLSETKISTPYKSFLRSHPDKNFQIVFYDGCLQKQFLQLPDGVELKTFKEISEKKHHEEDLEIIKQTLQGRDSESFFPILNNSFLSEGILIRVKKSLESPLKILYLHEKIKKAPLINIQNILVLEKKSSIDVVEEVRGIDKNTPPFLNIVSEFFLEEDSRINYLKVHPSSDTSNGAHCTKLHQNACSQSKIHHISLGGTVSHQFLEVNLNEPEAQTHVEGVFFSQGEEKRNVTCFVKHAKPHTKSHVRFKGVVGDNSVASFDGSVLIVPDAEKSDATLVNKNILLGEKPIIKAAPHLQVYNDDVKASHGCTTGQINPSEIFYLQSRGLNENQAKQIILHGFLKDISSEESSGIKNILKRYLGELKYVS